MTCFRGIGYAYRYKEALEFQLLECVIAGEIT